MNKNQQRNKKPPVKVICESVYIGDKTLSEAFFNIIYEEIAKKTT